ncbi:MAG TPA: hypothetical protein VM510_06215 [Caulifigura sp.]|nr:hypothetical protein [Caulifigura sp.]
MIVPRYWAEARIQRRDGRREVTVRRFGWSDASPEEAQRNANQRAEEAIAAILSGQWLPRRDLKRAYNGSAGVPIREEIVASIDSVRITRNAYGALCLNTPDVLFGDLDFAVGPPPLLIVITALGLFIMFASMTPGMRPATRLITGILGTLVFAGQLAIIRWKIYQLMYGTEEEQALKRIQKFVERRPDWLLRVYRTPSGLRILAMHRTFDPQEADVAECFRELKADEVYVRMCLRQNCFRARLTPKPWRIGINHHIRPRTTVWPVPPELQPFRDAWIREYEARSTDFAACRWIGDYGRGTIDFRVRTVQELHDRLSHANTELPLA